MSQLNLFHKKGDHESPHGTPKYMKEYMKLPINEKINVKSNHLLSPDGAIEGLYYVQHIIMRRDMNDYYFDAPRR